MSAAPLFATTVALVALFAGANSVVAAPNPAQGVHTNKTRFRIPYRHDAAEIQRLGAREIRLYVSVDRGARWQHSQSVAPDAGRFDFQAPQDGEYWFAVRTLDGRNQLHPMEDVIEPGLKVVVDTRAPVLDVSLRQLAAGKVQLSWQAEDEHLDATKLRLEYRQGGSGEWQPVSVVPTATGQTAWTAAAGGDVAVRGSIADLAQNVTQAQAQTRVAPAGLTAPRPGVPDLRQPIASDGDPDRVAVRFPGTISDADPTASATNRLDAPTGDVPKFGTGPLIAPDPTGRFVADRPEDRPSVTQDRYGRLADEDAPAATAPRAAGRNRVVNSTRFTIGYKIDDVGPSGIGSVDFYITQDEGRKWWKYGSDADHQSPFEVQVPEDGTYGFTLRARSGVGLAADPPQPGEPPAIVVVVDQTPPEVQLLPVQQGQGAALNRLHVRWKCSDANPSERPVALYYATDRNGPWEAISGWIPDRGQYEWTVGPGVPAKLFVRIAVRDEAGNQARAETEQPVLIDLTRPTARIVDVESIDAGTTPR